MSTHKISVIVPVYLVNKEIKQMTYDCLEGLYRTRGIDEVIVVDDGSPLKIKGTWFTVVERTENGGYAKAVNSGLAKATGDIVIVCNNDVEFVQPDWLEKIIYPLQNGYDISSIRTTDSDGWSTEDRISDNDKFGSIWAVKRSTLDTLGLLDDSFGKGYFEDLDYWHRARKAGLKVGKNHAGLVEHKGQQTFNTLGKEADVIYNLAMLKYAEKHPDAVLVGKDGGIVMSDFYDFEGYSPAERHHVMTNKVTIEEVKRAWGLE